MHLDADPDATVGDLRRAAGIGGSGLVHRDKLLPDERRLRATDVAQGDLLTDPGEVCIASSRPDGDLAVASVVAITGRSAGRAFELAPGRFVIGRSPSSAVHLADDSVSNVHAELAVGSTARFRSTTSAPRTERPSVADPRWVLRLGSLLPSSYASGRCTSVSTGRPTGRSEMPMTRRRRSRAVACSIARHEPGGGPPTRRSTHRPNPHCPAIRPR